MRDRLDLAFDDLGEQQVKNIARLVRIYGIALAASSRATLPVEAPLPLPDKPSLAVLPFRDLSLVRGLPSASFFQASSSCGIPASCPEPVRPPLKPLSRAFGIDFRRLSAAINAAVLLGFAARLNPSPPIPNFREKFSADEADRCNIRQIVQPAWTSLSFGTAGNHGCRGYRSVAS